jgi:hypothetical protein
MARRKALPTNALLLGGAAGAGYLVWKAARDAEKYGPYGPGSPQRAAIDAGTATYDTKAYHDPPTDYAHLPAAARQILIARNGADGTVNGKLMPRMKLSDMDEHAAYWLQLTKRVGSDFHNSLATRLGKVKAHLWGRLNKRLIEKGFAPIMEPPFGSTFVQVGQAYQTRSKLLFPWADDPEIRDFWYAIDQAGINVKSRLAVVDKTDLGTFWAYTKTSANELANSAGKAAAEAGKRGASLIGSIIAGFASGLGLVTVAALIGGGYLLLRRR